MYVFSNHSNAKICVGTSHEFDGNPSFKEYANIISMSSEIFQCGGQPSCYSLQSGYYIFLFMVIQSEAYKKSLKSYYEKCTAFIHVTNTFAVSL